MRLQALCEYVQSRGWRYKYTEIDGLGGINFDAGGFQYHIWEFCDQGVYGAESNVANAFRMEDYTGEYEEAILQQLKKLR